MRTAALGLGLMLGALTLTARAQSPHFLPPAQEARVHRLGKQLRCPVCQGLSIADSPSPMSQALMGKVRDLVRQGKTDQEIQAYFVARYGDWILLEPPRKGFDWLVWLMPLMVVLGGVGVVAWVVKRGPADASPEPTEGTGTAAGASDDPYLDAVRKEIDA